MGSTPIFSIPFADPTDLVRDWPALSEDVAEAVEAAVAGVPVLSGMGSNVVQTVKTNAFTTSSASYTAIDGLTATITPSSDTARVLVIAQVPVSTQQADNVSAFLRLTGGNTGGFIGNASGSMERATAWSGLNDNSAYRLARGAIAAAIIFLDSPASSSPVTYGVDMKRGVTEGNVFVNRSGDDNNNGNYGRVAASLTVIEVAP